MGGCVSVAGKAPGGFGGESRRSEDPCCSGRRPRKGSKVRVLYFDYASTSNTPKMLQQDENYRDDRAMLFATHTHDVISLVDRGIGQLSAEERLSNAWVALWGLRQFKLKSFAASAPAVAEAGQDEDESEAVQAAARRCAFLDAYPEHACREHALMMEAFMRRNKVAVERARANAIVQRVTACELTCKTHHSVPSKEAVLPETVATGMSHMR